ncbi:hypothetical protein [Rhizobium sp. SG741]|uniref:hypothetical protein n=1 Tax=Rhizobium sp. SG741 TaxID=2587114 RepID=UPI0014452DBA|nr:hypothetical protein [Rhizobium sp. SG741]NKJ09016.1 hypothetical protein [Rhizobium sp. SG741]
MRRFIPVLGVVVLGVGAALYGLVQDRLPGIVNKHWPPVSAEQQRQAAIDSSLDSLKAMTTPNVAVGTDVGTIQILLAEQAKDFGVTKLDIETDRQLLKVTAEFYVDFSSIKLSVKDDEPGFIEKFKPRVSGTLIFELGARLAMKPEPKRMIQVTLLPSLTAIHVDKVVLEDGYDASAAGKIIATMLTVYADNITGVFANNPILSAELPASLQSAFDPSRLLKIGPAAGSALKLELKVKSVSVPYTLREAATLIDRGGIVLLGELSVEAAPPSAHASGGTFDALENEFDQRLDSGLGVQSAPSVVWAAIAKPLIADSVNNAFALAEACLAGTGPIPSQSIHATVPTPDASTISCAPNMDCTPTRVCDLKEDTRDCRRPPQCTHNHDTRDCHGPGKTACEIAKAAQNKAYDRAFDACNAGAWISDQACEVAKGAQNATYATQKADCEAEKTKEKGACEATKESKRLGCETMKGAVSALHHLGNIGILDGSVSGNADLTICLQDVKLQDDLSAIHLSLDTSGSAPLHVSLKWTPVDVAGYALCQFPWIANKRINVTVPAQTVGVDVSLTSAADGSAYRGHLEATPIHLKFSPSPLSLILQNINFNLACPATAALINGMTLNLAPFIPEVLKDYTHKLDPMEFSFSPDIPEQIVAGHTIKPVLTEAGRALIVSGSLRQ